MSLEFLIFNCTHHLCCVFPLWICSRLLSFIVAILLNWIIPIWIVHKQTLRVLLEFFTVSGLEEPLRILVSHAPVLTSDRVVLLRGSNHIIVAASWLFTGNIYAFRFLFNALLARLVVNGVGVGPSNTAATLPFTGITIWNLDKGFHCNWISNWGSNLMLMLLGFGGAISLFLFIIAGDGHGQRNVFL